MSNRAYGYITGKIDSYGLFLILEGAVNQLSVGVRPISNLGVRPITNSELFGVPDKFITQKNGCCFELTAGTDKYTADRLLDPSDWSPFVDIPVSWKVDERIQVLGMWLELLASAYEVNELAIAITDHKVNKVRGATGVEIRELIAVDCKEGIPPDTLYIVDCSEYNSELRKQTERSIFSLYWRLVQGGELSASDVHWVVEKLRARDLDGRETEQAILILGKLEVKEYRDVVESFLRSEDYLCRYAAFRVVWSIWKEYEKYRKVAVSYLREPEVGGSARFKRAILGELQKYFGKVQDIRLVREVYLITKVDHPNYLHSVAYDVLRQLFGPSTKELAEREVEDRIEKWLGSFGK